MDPACRQWHGFCQSWATMHSGPNHPRRARPALSAHGLDVLLLGGGALAAGALAIVVPSEVVLTSGALLGLVWLSRPAQRFPWVAAVVVALALGLGALRAHLAVKQHEDERARSDRAMPHPARCFGQGRVESSPTRVRDVLRWDARLFELSCDDAVWSNGAPPQRWAGRATLYGGPDELARGDEVEVIATLAAPQRLWNLAAGDPRPSEALRGSVRSGGALDVRVVRRGFGWLATIDRARAAVRRRIDATFSSDLAPMARALVLGENDLAPEDDSAFRASGLSHLLAVSGMHLVLVLALFVRGLESALVRIEPFAARVDAGRFSAAAGLPVAWAYAEFAGAGGSTLRAAWMASVVLAARSAGKRSDSVRAFALSIAMMALVDPLVAFDLSFALSAGATGGLLAWGQPLGRSLSARAPAWAEPAARAIGTTMAASIPCIPIVARFAPTVPLGGIVANLVAVPVGESAALPLCLTHALLASWPAAERGSALAASGALVLVRAVASFASEPWALIKVPEPDSWQLAVVIVIAGAFALRCPLSRPVGWVGTAALLALEFEIRRAGAPRGELRITFLDVGQGDAALIDLPNGEALLIDAGGLVGSPIDVGARVLAPVLRARRRNAIAAAILTHPHPDHFGGFLTGLEGIEVGAFWDTGEGEREDMRGGYEAVIGAMRARGVPIVRPSLLCGEHSLGGAHIEVLEPCPDFSSDRGPNDNSFVLRISFGERAFLFVGDAEHAEESDLLSHAGGRLRADVLKVGHHGSRTSSSPQFLAAVMPRFAVISVGQRNRFGHPQEATLRALGAAGARTWRTDRDGSVTITTDGQSIEAHAQATAR